MKLKIMIFIDRFRKDLGKRKRLVLVSIILAYPIWMLLLSYIMIVWPGYPFWALLYRYTEPDTTMQEEFSIWAWNCWLQLFFLTGHPEIHEAREELIGAYRLLGKPGLVMMARIFGNMLIGWGFSSRVYVLLLFPYLLFEPYIPIRYRVKQIIKFALIMFYLFVFSFIAFTV